MQSSQQTPPVNDIRSQLRTFINLLQTSNPSQYKSIKSPGRLSVILSASQPQSSSMDKSSTNQSAPRSIKNSQFDTTQRPLIEQIFKQLLATSLTKNQEKLLNQLSCCIDQILKKSTMLEESIFAMEDQLSKEKKGTDELLEALIKMDEEQKQIWNTYYQLSDQFKAKSTEFDILKTQNSQLKQHIDTYKKELKFVKNLVYVANQNYQQLQGQYHKIVQKSTLSSKNLKPVLVLRQKRSQQNLLTQRSDLSKSSYRNMCSPYEQQQKSRGISTDRYQLQSSYSPVRKSSKSLKSRRSISPLMKDKQNIECNFKDVYRKMIMKNLKSKKRKTQQSNNVTKDLYA